MTNENKRNDKVAEEQALQRYQLIAPLLDESLDNAKRIQLRETISGQNGLSSRTLYRYEAAYRKGGFSGLKPQDRETKRSPKLPENFDELLEQAIQLKRGSPKTFGPSDHLYPGTGGARSPGSPEALHDGALSLQSRIRRPSDADVQRCQEELLKTVLQTASDDADPGRH